MKVPDYMVAASSSPVPTVPLAKSPTGIAGFDLITSGGLPKGRTTVVCGGPGSGKTLFAMEFLIRGAREFGEPGVLVTFEETAEELSQDAATLGLDVASLVSAKKIIIDHVMLERSEITDTGEFDLDGLFVRLAHAVDTIAAKRIVLDTPETLLAGLPNPLVVRSELRRLFRWFKDRGLTAVITAERGEKTLTREGLEEYVSDCVILLDQRVEREVATRRMQIIKYRGSSHSTNEFPFLIDRSGLSVIPITGSKLDHPAPVEHLPTGVPALDEMLGGRGPYRSSSILLSGPAGTGKSTFAASFVNAACARGERAIYFSFEESPETLIRDFRSVGIDLAPWVAKGLLQFHCSRATASGLEMHVALMTRAVRAFHPHVAVVDPISAFDAISEPREAKNMVTVLADMLRAEGVTALMTYLSHEGAAMEATVLGISSSVDTWVLLRDKEVQDERRRVLYVLKSRGMHNSNLLREYRLTERGIILEPAKAATPQGSP